MYQDNPNASAKVQKWSKTCKWELGESYVRALSKNRESYVLFNISLTAIC